MNTPEMYDYLMRSRRDLWAALERLPDEVLSRNLLNGERFRCIKDLLFHMAEVEDGWTHLDLQNQPAVQEQFPDVQGRNFFGDVPLADILTYWRAVEADTLRYLGTLTEAEAARKVAPDDWHGVQFTVDGLLWHVFIHEVRHSAQITALLRTQGIKPPWLDFLIYQLPPEAKAFVTRDPDGA
ncbi:DUF664 domain-containing protein [Deinococcus cavernae]|uniref:DUF664 domain-containing protein n=1 Tax=Deinococcus cavernae TaxID=2320857 RepID=A0A418V067_9DEIO|nr:DinB family protein [Deinococcus cavernae]RJF69115.1 DUF664 domain-containing protein [Deinococcus cavernae]